MHWAVTLLLFMFGIPDMVEDYHTWTKWVDVDLPRGIGTVLFLLGVLCFLLTYYRGGERWAIIHLPWIGRWWALRHFRKLESKLDTFSRQDMGFEYAEINELAHMLGGIGIEYPTAGIDWRLRKLVTADLLAACKAEDWSTPGLLGSGQGRSGPNLPLTADCEGSL